MSDGWERDKPIKRIGQEIFTDDNYANVLSFSCCRLGVGKTCFALC